MGEPGISTITVTGTERVDAQAACLRVREILIQLALDMRKPRDKQNSAGDEALDALLELETIITHLQVPDAADLVLQANGFDLRKAMG